MTMLTLCTLYVYSTPSLTSFIADMDGTELYLIHPESLAPYILSQPMLPVCLYKYLAASMARKYGTRIIRILYSPPFQLAVLHRFPSKA